MSEHRCQARHGERPGLQCQNSHSRPEIKCSMHLAVDARGVAVRWNNLVAVYPARDIGADGRKPDGARHGQVSGDHYRKFKIQPWDIWQEYELDAFSGAVLKYLLRAGRKGSKLEDLKKARHTLDALIEIEEAREG